MSVVAARSQLYDAARGLGVLAVIAYHCVAFLVADNQPDDPVDLEWWIFGVGTLGVDMFFVLSGFLLVGSWHSIRRRHDRLRLALADYAGRRARRILPAYWVSLAVLVPLSAPALLQSADGLKRLALLGGVQQYVDRWLPGEVNRAYWSLTTEVHFYLLLPLLAFALRRFGPRALLALSLTITMGWRLWTPDGAAESLIFGRIDQFVAGMAAAGLVVAFDAGRPSRLCRWLLSRPAPYGMVGGLLAIGLYQGGSQLSRTGPLPGSDWIHPLAGLLFAGLFIRGACLARRPRRSAAPFAAVGLVSYSLYLWHIPVIEAGLNLTGLDQPGAPPQAIIAVLMVLLAVTAAVSWLSFRWFEAPFLESRRAETPPVPSSPTPAAQPSLVPS